MKAFVNSLGLGRVVDVQPLTQDASDRRFYRIYLKDRSFVLMELLSSRPFIDAPVRLYHPADGELPYLNIGRYMSGIGVPVPKVISFDRTAGLILLEDMGTLLLSEIIARQPDAAPRLYKKAIDILITMQSGGKRKPDPGCFAFRMRFDFPIIRWELEHFLEFGIEARFGRLPSPVRTEIGRELDSLAHRIDRIDRVLMHRDFHARNLIVNEAGEIGVVDFQDALLGPETYDLASLLFDAYTEIDDCLKEELVRYYLAERQAYGLEPRAFDEFYALVKLTALQRHLKIIGRFVFLAERKGKPAFLSYIPRVQRRVLSIVSEVPDAKRLERLIRPYLGGAT